MSVTRLLKLLGASVATVVAVMVPAAYGTFAVLETRRSLGTETTFHARAFEQIVGDRPEMWEYETLRLLEIASLPAVDGQPVERILHNAAGKVVVRTAYAAPRPFITVAIPFYDYGHLAGNLEAHRSIRHILVVTGLLAIVGLGIGAGAYIVFWIIPIRSLDQALATLAAEQRKSEATLQSIADGVVAVDAGGKVQFMNQTAEELLGGSSGEAIGKPLDEVFPVRRHGELKIGQTGTSQLLRASDGAERTIEEVRSPLTDERGRETGSVIVFRDVTERLRTEEQLAKARQLESIGILAGGLAHDFNNLLTGIMGNISLAKLNLPGNDRALGRLDEAERASQRAHELAVRLMTFSKGGKPVRTVLAPAPLVEEASLFAVRGTGVKCVFQAPGDLWNLDADPGQVSQVVNNIVINAVQASKGRGTVTVSMENAEFAERQHPLVQAGRYVLIRIEDSGPGIPPGALARIFEPYFTTKEKGTGLGLATCYSIVKSHRGYILADSPPGRGAVFSVYLPATDKALETASGGAERGVARGQGRVLLMDDDETIREVGKEMLSHLGYAVNVCENGEQAVAEYQRGAVQREPYDVVIMDLTIPGGMGGKDAARVLLDIDPSAKLIVSSGYSSDPVLASPAEYGFQGVVGKPYRVADLVKVVQTVVAGGRGVAKGDAGR